MNKAMEVTNPEKECMCQFGSINIETGESCDGKMVGNIMTFKFNLWQSIKNKIRFIFFGNPYKKKTLYRKPKIEVLRDVPLFRRNRFTGEERGAGHLTIYRKFDPDTNKTLKIWSKNIHNDFFGNDQYDIEIWEQTGRLEKL